MMRKRIAMDERNDKNKQASDPSKEESEEILNQLTSDLRRLDEQEREAKKISYYDKYRVIFLMQSTLLGISYSIIWPTLWVYAKNEFELSMPLVKLVYGLTFVAYPVASMLSAYVVENSTMKTKSLILVLGGFEIVGNLVFALNYHPVLLVIGRFIAGLGDAFYVILMKDMKTKQGHNKNETKTMECLAAFIVGVILSPGINILTTLIPFNLKGWRVNSNNYPGLTTSVLFTIMELIMLIVLPKQFEHDRDRSPNSSESQEDLQNQSIIPDFRQWGYKAIFVGFFSFLYTYIVALFEIAIPFLIYEKLAFHARSAMLLYAILGTLYAMILMVGMTVNIRKQLQVSIGIAVLAKTGGLFGVLYLQFADDEICSMISLGVVVLALAILWASDDILFINLVRVFIPGLHREHTHNLRKSVSKFAFAIAGVSVAFCMSNAYIYVGPLLIFFVYLCFCVFVTILCLDTAIYKNEN